jgi:hypothetical protein
MSINESLFDFIYNYIQQKNYQSIKHNQNEFDCLVSNEPAHQQR